MTQTTVLLSSRVEQVMSGNSIPIEVYKRVQELSRIGQRAVLDAQEENRRQGIPNVYSINGVLYWELPDGTLSRTDPYDESKNSDSAPR